MTGERPRPMFVSWTRYSRRSESVAAALGADAIFVESWKDAGVVLLPLRYLRQAFTTWRTLRRRRPEVIITMNPPIVLPLLAYLYAAVFRTRFAVDSHTGAFIGTWGRTLFLHRFLSRRAVCTIVTNAKLAAGVQEWGARAFVLPIEIPDFPVEGGAHGGERPTVCVINSFSDDEPLPEILAASERLQDCRFCITGKMPPDRRQALLSEKPVNVTYTDYLAQDDYIRLLNSADVIVVLVKFDDTLLQGAAEAVAVEKPLITSDWPVLRRYFSRGTLYVDNSSEDIVRAVKEALERRGVLSREMHELRGRLEQEWQQQCRALRHLVMETEESSGNAGDAEL